MACTCVKKPQKRVKMGALGDCEPHVWLFKKKKKKKERRGVCMCVCYTPRKALHTSAQN
jgi:hypothetical protein